MSPSHLIRSSLLWTVLVLALTFSPSARASEPNAAGSLVSLAAFPEKVTLDGADRVQQLVITGHFGDGSLRDRTSQAAYRVADPQVARVEASGMIVPLANGNTEVLVESEGHTVTVALTVKGTEKDRPINFANDILPILSKQTCNSGGCHGKNSGQNGFKLSLLASEPQLDFNALVKEGRGRRLFPAAPEQSLLLLKATGAMGHGGGKLLATDSPAYRTIVRWVRQGTPFGLATDPKVTSIRVEPAQRLMPLHGRQQIAVTAHYSDGSQEDVTRRAEYVSNDDQMLTVTENGLIQALDLPGEGTVVVRYLGQLAVYRAIIPLPTPTEKFQPLTPTNLVDERVFAKLRQLGIPPSELCTDSEFLRRVSLDITGTLPTPAEVEKFLADSDPNKRAKRVDELLERPTYAAYFALKWCDLLHNRRRGNSPMNGEKPGPEDLARTTAFRDWVRQGLAQNKPYDQFVRELLTAQGNVVGADANPPTAWYTQVRSARDLAENTAQVFLGTRIQCAQCHHHPYEKWSRDDYNGLVAFFDRVRWKDPKGKAANNINVNTVAAAVVVASPGELPKSRRVLKAKPLDGAELEIPAEEDSRARLADWMTDPRNPFFARALVNRYWAHFFGRGIVDPLDDLRVTNPPSNPELLDALAQDFIQQKYDLRQLIRTICTSKTYQFSSVPNALNRKDKQNFSRHIPKLLPAEVLLDAIDQVNNTRTTFRFRDALPAEGKDKKLRDQVVAIRAIDLPDEQADSNFLTIFGKPRRETACECERVSGASLSQTLHRLNSKEIQEKLASPSARAALLAADPQPDVDKVRELYLWFYARQPTPQEQQAVNAYVARKGTTAEEKRRAYEDIVWALLNTNEFLFNH